MEYMGQTGKPAPKGAFTALMYSRELNIIPTTARSQLVAAVLRGKLIAEQRMIVDRPGGKPRLRTCYWKP